MITIKLPDHSADYVKDFNNHALKLIGAESWEDPGIMEKIDAAKERARNKLAEGKVDESVTDVMILAYVKNQLETIL